jgi:hypothetical protein
MHAIMRPDFSSYYHSPQPDLTGVYEDQKQHHLHLLAIITYIDIMTPSFM